MDKSVSGFENREGWLSKWTNYINGYQKRWFVLSHGLLTYYLSKDEVSSGYRGQIVLRSATIVRDNSHDFRVFVESSLTYYLRASNAANCQDWIKALKRANGDSLRNGQDSNPAWLDGNHRPSESFHCSYTAIESQLKDLRSCNALVTEHSAAISTTLAALESNKISPNIKATEGDVAKLKALNESVLLFRMTSSAMVSQSEALMKLLKSRCHSEHNFDIAKARSNAVESSEDDDIFEDAADIISMRFMDEREDSSEAQKLFVDRVSGTPKNWIYAKHRNRIPNKPNYKLNLWSILKNCIGRDISKLPVPVNFNEPLSVLQRLTEELEYSELLDKAAVCSDSCEQMIYVVAFSVSSYSTTAYRTGKPFNPLLGETYEFDSKDEFGYRWFAEQVSHHPPKAAIHVESTTRDRDGWSYWYEVSPSSKFRGNYLELLPMGTCHVKFHSSGNHYTWRKVTITVNNIILGKLWFDQSGESNFINHTTGDRCAMRFFPYNFLDSAAFRKISGTVVAGCGTERYLLHGTWDKSLSCTSISPRLQDEVLIWKVNGLPPTAKDMYSFTKFAMLLNEWVDGTAPTDSRRRPDQRKMELAHWDEANEIKLELEERQRKRRRKKENDDLERQKQGLPPKPYKPRWFKKSKCSVTGENEYVFTHEYWEAKERQEWSRCSDIYDLSGEKSEISLEKNWPDLVRSSRVTD